METTNREGEGRSARVWQEAIDSPRPIYKDGDVLFINGLMFERVELTLDKTPLVRARMLFIIEDINDGDVHVATYWNRGQGIRNIYFGSIGTAFKLKYGADFRSQVRVWAARQQSYEFGKYQVETYLLPRMANKRLRQQRVTVQRRAYLALSKADQAKWRERYPYAVPYIVEGVDFEGDNLGRA